MKKTSFFCALALLMLSACSQKPYYQVYDIESPDVQLKNNMLIFENAECVIKYNLWAEGGNLSYLITNKTDKNLYIVMPKSFFILNGVANDYYSESSFTRSVTNSSKLSTSSNISIGGFLTDGLYWYPSTLGRQFGASYGTSLTESIETKEAPFVCVPPQASKFIKGFNISDYVYKDCYNLKFNYPSRLSQIVEYDRSNTPLSFRNRVAYTFDEKAAETKYVDHLFWLSSLRNYSTKGALSKQKYEECETNAKRTMKSFTMSAPNKFYNKYLKVNKNH